MSTEEENVCCKLCNFVKNYEAFADIDGVVFQNAVLGRDGHLKYTDDLVICPKSLKSSAERMMYFRHGCLFSVRKEMAQTPHSKPCLIKREFQCLNDLIEARTSYYNECLALAGAGQGWTS